MRTAIVFILVALVALVGANGLLRRDVSALQEKASQFEARLEKLEAAKSAAVSAPASVAVRATLDPPAIVVPPKDEPKTFTYTVVSGDQLHVITHKQNVWGKADMDKYEAAVKKLNENVKDWDFLGVDDELTLPVAAPFITQTRAEANAAVRAARPAPKHASLGGATPDTFITAQ